MKDKIFPTEPAKPYVDMGKDNLTKDSNGDMFYKMDDGKWIFLGKKLREPLMNG